MLPWNDEELRVGMFEVDNLLFWVGVVKAMDSCGFHLLPEYPGYPQKRQNEFDNPPPVYIEAPV